MTHDHGGDASATRRRRPRRIVRWVLGGLLALVVAAVVGVLVWTQVGVMAAEPEALAAVRDDPSIAMSEVDGNVVLAPAGVASDTGLVFLAGAKVEAEAYAAKLSGLVRDDAVTVVLVQPTLNVAFFDFRPLSAFTALAPGVSTWAVGGHSLGGVRACSLAGDADALVLSASYCAADLSADALPVLSVSGSADGLSTPAKIDAARGKLPADAEYVQIPGAAHASFGDYGAQPGDGTPTISDAAMTAALTDAVGTFLAAL